MGDTVRMGGVKKKGVEKSKERKKKLDPKVRERK